LQEIPLASIWFTSLAKDSSHSSNLKVKTLRITYKSEISSLSVVDPGINISTVNLSWGDSPINLQRIGFYAKPESPHQYVVCHRDLQIYHYSPN
jgi:hypothetical protein